MSFIKKHKVKFAILTLFYIAYVIVSFYGPKGYQMIGVSPTGLSTIGNVIQVGETTENTETDEIKGDIYTIGLPSINNPPLIMHFLARFDKKVQIYKFNSSFTAAEDSAYSSLLYDEAINSSIVAAYNAAEIDITYNNELRIALVLSKGNNAGFPYPSKINSVNGVSVANVEDFKKIVDAKTEATCSEKLSVNFTEVDATTSGTKELVGAWDGTSCKYGIILQNHITNIEVANPMFKFTVRRPQNVGGNSGGLMQTLKIYNELMRLKDSSFDLIKERHIAGTGTIDISGNVGPIGGSYQKLYTVNYAKADVFFILDDEGKATNNYDGAKKAYDELKAEGKLHEFAFVKVKTLQDAINFLNGGTR